MKICEKAGCSKPVHARNLCLRHYQILRRSTEFVTLAKKPKKSCKVTNCNNTSRALGYCNKHYKQVKAHGRTFVNKLDERKSKKSYIIWKRIRGFGRNAAPMDPSWDDFDIFYEEMGDPPTIKHMLYRIDIDEPYSKINCIWSTNSRDDGPGGNQLAIERWRLGLPTTHKSQENQNRPDVIPYEDLLEKTRKDAAERRRRWEEENPRD